MDASLPTTAVVKRQAARARPPRAEKRSAAEPATQPEDAELTEDGANDENARGPTLLDHIDNHTDSMYQLVGAYYRGSSTDPTAPNRRLVRHHIDSMNHFVRHQMMETLSMFSPRTVTIDEDFNQDVGDHNLQITYSIQNLQFSPPQLYENNGATKPMYPRDARLRNYTYAARTTVDLEVTVSHRYIVDANAGSDLNRMQTATTVIRGLKFIDMPIMVGSHNCLVDQRRRSFQTSVTECELDCGGYFIVKGTEKVVIGQEHAAENKPYIYASKRPKWDWIAEYRSVPDTKCISPKQMEIAVASRVGLYGRGIYVTIPRMRPKVSIELFALFRALGVESDREICDIIMTGVDDPKKADMLRFLEASIHDGAMARQRSAPPLARPRSKRPAATNDLSPVCEAAFLQFMATIAHDNGAPAWRAKLRKDGGGGANPPKPDLDAACLGDGPAGATVDLGGQTYQVDAIVALDKLSVGVNKYVQSIEAMDDVVDGQSTDVVVRGGSSRFPDLRLDGVMAVVFSQLTRYELQHRQTGQAQPFGEFFLRVLGDRKQHTKSVLDRRKEYTQEVINNELFPHCKTRLQKIYLLGLVTNRLIQTALGWLEPADRDSYLNKRIESTGVLINNLFRNLTGRFIKDVDRRIQAEIKTGTWTDPFQIVSAANIHQMFVPNPVENGIVRALSTGDFSVKQSGSNSKVGVAQVLSRLNPAAAISHLRRINTPLEKTGELIAPRKLHGTTVGFLCPVETPEGQSVGAIKNLSILTVLTVSASTAANQVLYEEVAPLIEPLALGRRGAAFCASAYNGRVKVLVNGAWVGVVAAHLDATECHRLLLRKKWGGVLGIYTSVVFDIPHMEIRVCSDGGRLCRPLFRVGADGRVLLTNDHVRRIRDRELFWDDLLRPDPACPDKGPILEYLDEEEQAFACVALRIGAEEPQEGRRAAGKYMHHLTVDAAQHGTLRYTHCEIHASTWLGFLAANIPFPHFNQSPRNAYQTAMGKQAMSVTSTLPVTCRMDKTSYELNYPSRALVNTRMADIVHAYKLPSGCQVHVAIMSYTGYNQEDSVIINEAAVRRGLFWSTVYHTEKDDDRGNSREEVVRCVPNRATTRGMKMANYGKLDPATGMVAENTLMRNRDVYLGKKAQIKENRADPSKIKKYDDCSRVCRTSEDMYLHKNYSSRNGEGYGFTKTQFRISRRINIGDKFASRAAQKGTCGYILPECDMPFTADGLRPDIILNPHAIPSRMTVAHLAETHLGKILIELGLFGDATCFGDLTAESIAGALANAGMHRHGEEIMYDGASGKQLSSSIFIGPIFYQRLKHMVNDKEHSRAIGPMVNLTRQPADGRARDGGFRVGEMERDAILAHGTADFCMDRMFYASDKYWVHVCRRCGSLAVFNDGKAPAHLALPNFSIHECRVCRNTVDFGCVRLPYSAKLLFQELQTIGVSPRLMIS